MRFAALILAFTATLAGTGARGADTSDMEDASAQEIASSAERVEPLMADGKTKLPALVLRSVDGKPFDLNKSIAEKPAVLIFYRGNWCPYCAAHLAAVQKVSKDITEAGFQIIAISPDKPEQLKKSVRKAGLTYTLLSDSTLEAARAFGLAYRVSETDLEKLGKFGIDLSENSGEKLDLLPVPALYLVAPDGKILFSYFNADYTKRLPTEDLLKALGTPSALEAVSGLE